MKKNKGIFGAGMVGNPFLLYSLTFTLTLIIYALHWTSLFPEIRYETVFFLVTTIVIGFFLALLFRKKCTFVKIRNARVFYGKIVRHTILSFFLLAIDCAYSKSIPLFGYIRGSADGALYKEFGMPVLHVIVVNYIMLLFYFSAYCYFSLGGFKNIFLKITLILLFTPLLFMNRAMMMYMLFGFILMFIMSRRISLRSFLLTMSSGLIILYFFGLTGNMRNGDYTGEYIMNIGGATDEFRESVVPKEFFWSYVYIATPLGNLQNAINEKKIIASETQGPELVFIHQIVPQFISKRIDLPKPDFSKYLVVPQLTVGTTYFDSYVTWGWGGMWMVFLTMMLYSVFMLNKVPIGSLVHVPLLCLLSTMTFFSSFSNLIPYMGLFPQLVVIFCLRNLHEKNIKLHSVYGIISTVGCYILLKKSS